MTQLRLVGRNRKPSQQDSEIEPHTGLVASGTSATRTGNLSLGTSRGFLGSIALAKSGNRFVQCPCGRLGLSVGV